MRRKSKLAIALAAAATAAASLFAFSKTKNFVKKFHVKNIGETPSPQPPSKAKLLIFGTLGIALMVTLAFVQQNMLKTSLFSTNQKASIVTAAKSWIGTPYSLGGCDKGGVDCSCFTRNVLSSAVGVNLPRTSREQATVGRFIAKSDLGVGDLVFFATGGGTRISHVGVVTKVSGGDVWMTHANSYNNSVLEDKITGVDYWEKTYVTAREITEFTKDIVSVPVVDTTAYAVGETADATGVPYTDPVTGNLVAEGYPASEPGFEYNS